jgi:single-strand DNA-binding protein
MSKDLNKVQLIGRLGADAEIRYTPAGSPIAKLRVATSRGWKDADGKDREETEWTNVVAWNKLAEIIGKYGVKGPRGYIEGRLQTRSWEADGVKKYMTEVIANDYIMLDSRRESSYESSFPSDEELEPEPAPAPKVTPQLPRDRGTGARTIVRKPAPQQQESQDDLPF